MSNRTPIKLSVPRQDLAETTIFQATAKAAQSWAQGLPVTNTKMLVQQLRSAIGELNRVDMPPDVRFNIMEALRPGLNIALSSMSKRFLNQSLVMPEELRQLSELADNLYSLATSSYTLVAVQTLQRREQIQSIIPAKLLTQAIARAMNFAGKKMLQTFQLHHVVSANAWRELHQLYFMAESQQLANLAVEDKLDGERTITTIYLQSIVLGCCKPNQLRQSDLAAIYRGLQEWNNFIRLEKTSAGEGLFLVDLASDQPAVYSSLYDDSSEDQYRLINTTALVSLLVKIKKDNIGGTNSSSLEFDSNTSLPPNMLDHLISSLGSMSTRNFSRTVSREALSISIGLSSTHYHVAEQCTFEQVLFGADYTGTVAQHAAGNRFLEKTEERGELADEPELIGIEEYEQEKLTPQERYPIYPINMIDASPGGYCLEWTADLPSSIRTGDIAGVREGQHGDWVIAVIRWVSQLKDAKSLIGVELLSPRAMPYGARIQQITGAEAPLMRVLLLPEIRLVGQPHTLITPLAGFKERQKVTLLREGEEFLIQLLRQVSATGNFAQFDFRYIKHLEQVVAEDKTGPLDSVFDSLWSNI